MGYTRFVSSKDGSNISIYDHNGGGSSAIYANTGVSANANLFRFSELFSLNGGKILIMFFQLGSTDEYAVYDLETGVLSTQNLVNSKPSANSQSAIIEELGIIRYRRDGYLTFDPLTGQYLSYVSEPIDPASPAGPFAYNQQRDCLVAMAPTDSEAFYYPVTSAGSVGVEPTLGTGVAIPGPTGSGNLCAWSPDGTTFLYTNFGRRSIEICSWDGSTMSHVQTVSLTEDVASRVRFDPTGYYFAVGTDDNYSDWTATCTLRIFGYDGAAWAEVASHINQGGGNPVWSIDGVTIFDPMWRRTLDFDRSTESLVNETFNSDVDGEFVIEILTFETQNVPTFAYDAGIEKLSAGTLNTNNLYLSLLSTVTTFDPTHATKADVVGANQATGGNIDADGILLSVSGPTILGDGETGLDIDSVSHGQTGGSVTFREALICEGTGTSAVPLCLLRMSTVDETISSGSNLIIDFKESGPIILRN